MKFMDSFRFFSTSLSILADNLSEGLHNYKCTNCKSCINYISTKDNLLIFKCIECSKNHKNHFDKDLKIYMNCVRKVLINVFYY